MQHIEIIIIGIGLAMDAFAVSVSSGVAIKKMHLKHAMLMASFFGGFQALMPILGWCGGTFFRKSIQSFDHWIAFGLLTVIGIKMIYESTKLKDDEKQQSDPHSIYILFTLAVATSIDALAVGVTFSCLNYNIWEAAALIGIITFIISFIGTQLGQKIGHHLGENKVEILGGVILIGIGIKILLEHLMS